MASRAPARPLSVATGSTRESGGGSGRASCTNPMETLIAAGVSARGSVQVKGVRTSSPAARAARKNRQPTSVESRIISSTYSVSGSRAAGLLQIGDHVEAIRFLRQADEDHARARHHLARIGQVFIQRGFVPGETAVLHGIGVAVTVRRARLAPDNAMQRWADLVHTGLNRMTHHAFVEDL